MTVIISPSISDRQNVAKNVLTVKGRGGMLPTPDLPLNSQNIIINGESSAIASNSSVQPISTSYGAIIPAQGVIKTEDGRIILTAYRTNTLGNNIPKASINCRL